MAYCDNGETNTPCKTGPGSQSGFSLIEAMIVMVIISILVAVAAPGFQNLIGNNRMISEVYALRSTLNHARSEAMARRAAVIVCPTTDGTTCADSDDWSTGYISFVDTNNDNAADSTDPDEEIIKFETERAAIDMVFSNANRRVRFGSQGIALGFEGVFTFCDVRGATQAKALILDPVGSIRAATDTDDPKDSIVNDAGDTNVSCS